MALAEVGAGDFITAETINYIIQRAVNRPVCRLVLPSGTQTITTGVNTAVLFPAGSEVFDDLNWHNTSTNTDRITPTYAGRFLVQGGATWGTGGAAASNRIIFPLKNGAALASWTRFPSPISAGMAFGFSDVVELNGTTDYINMAARHENGSNLTIVGAGETSASTFLSLTYLGDSL